MAFKPNAAKGLFQGQSGWPKGASSDGAWLPPTGFRPILPAMKRLVLIAAALVGLAACEEEPLGPVAINGPAGQIEQGLPPATPFDPRDFAWSVAPGTDALTGTLAYRHGGLPYGCEGEDVLLIPEVAWSRRRMIILYGSATSAAVPASIVRARTPSAPPGDYARFVRRTTCDAQGRFAFNRLPDGGWYVLTVAKPLDVAGEPMAIIRRVEIHGGARAITLS